MLSAGYLVLNTLLTLFIGVCGLSTQYRVVDQAMIIGTCFVSILATVYFVCHVYGG